MTDTNKRLAIVTDARGIGVMQATQQPVALGMAGRVDPRRTTGFQESYRKRIQLPQRCRR